MTGPPLKIHVDPDAIPKALSTASSIPTRLKNEVKETFDRHIRIGLQLVFCLLGYIIWLWLLKLMVAVEELLTSHI